MPVQNARHENLRALLADLNDAGVVGYVAQARRLGCTVTPKRLQAMAEGGPIGALFAEHIEYLLGKPRRWMDEVHDDEMAAMSPISG